MNIINIAGLLLNAMGSLAVAFSFGDLKGLPGKLTPEKSKLIYPVGVIKPKIFYIGIIFIIIGFLLQFVFAFTNANTSVSIYEYHYKNLIVVI